MMMIFKKIFQKKVVYKIFKITTWLLCFKLSKSVNITVFMWIYKYVYWNRLKFIFLHIIWDTFENHTAVPYLIYRVLFNTDMKNYKMSCYQLAIQLKIFRCLNFSRKLVVFLMHLANPSNYSEVSHKIWKAMAQLNFWNR